MTFALIAAFLAALAMSMLLPKTAWAQGWTPSDTIHALEGSTMEL